MGFTTEKNYNFVGVHSCDASWVLLQLCVLFFEYKYRIISKWKCYIQILLNK